MGVHEDRLRFVGWHFRGNFEIKPLLVVGNSGLQSVRIVMLFGMIDAGQFHRRRRFHLRIIGNVFHGRGEF